MCLQARLKNWKGAGWWSGNVFQSLEAAALKAAAAEEEADRERRLHEGR